MYQVKLRRIATISDHTSIGEASISLASFHLENQKLTGAGGGACRSKGASRSNGESEEGGGELHGCLALGCWLRWTYGMVRGQRTSQLSTQRWPPRTTSTFPSSSISGTLPQSNMTRSTGGTPEEQEEEQQSIVNQPTSARRTSINGYQISSRLPVIPIKA